MALKEDALNSSFFVIPKFVVDVEALRSIISVSNARLSKACNQLGIVEFHVFVPEPEVVSRKYNIIHFVLHLILYTVCPCVYVNCLIQRTRSTKSLVFTPPLFPILFCMNIKISRARCCLNLSSESLCNLLACKNVIPKRQNTVDPHLSHPHLSNPHLSYLCLSDHSYI
jgi:hypothetical protein